MTKLDRLIASSKAKPWKDNDILAKCVEHLVLQMREIMACHNVKDIWRLAAKSIRELDTIAGEDTKK